MPSRRKPKPVTGRHLLPPEVPEAAQQPALAPAAVAGDEDLLPDELLKMLQAAYT